MRDMDPNACTRPGLERRGAHSRMKHILPLFLIQVIKWYAINKLKCVRNEVIILCGLCPLFISTASG